MKLGMDCAVRCLSTMVPSFSIQGYAAADICVYLQVHPGIIPFLYNHIICCQGNHAISHNQNIFLFKDNCFCTQVVSLNK